MMDYEDLKSLKTKMSPFAGSKSYWTVKILLGPVISSCCQQITSHLTLFCV